MFDNFARRRQRCFLMKTSYFFEIVRIYLGKEIIQWNSEAENKKSLPIVLVMSYRVE